MHIEQVAESIRRNGWMNDLHYLASPYTNYPHGLDRAARDVSLVAGHLMIRGICVFAPIVHGHGVDSVAKLGQGHDFWMKQCLIPFMCCRSVIVAKLPGYAESKGVNMEIGWAADHDMPVFHLDLDLAGLGIQIN